MIKTKTVLVLGAGASAPYGLPVGARLRDLISEMSVADLDRLPIAPGTAREQGLAQRFKVAFQRSQAFSIDEFLSRRREFVDLGKSAIAACLLPLEVEARLLDGNPDDNWYRYLVKAMDAPWDELHLNKVSFITFNYDRSLEAFLANTFQHKYGKSPAEALAMVATFPIVHVYGSFGSIDPNAQDHVPFGIGSDPNMLPAAIPRAASGLQIIDERRDDAPSFNQAKALLGEAMALCFLGFGFDPTNVARLGGKDIGAAFRLGERNNVATRFAATAFGMTNAEQDDAVVRISNGNGQQSARLSMFNAKCLETLRHSLILSA